MKKLVLPFLFAVVGGFTAIAIYPYLSSTHKMGQSQEGIPAHYASYLNQEGENPTFTAAAEIAIHAVVHIKTTSEQKSPVYDDFFGFNPFDFYGLQQPQQQTQKVQAAGSGVIISENGYIVTNNHVVANATEIEVTLNNKKTYKADVIGTDPSTDLALIKIKEENLPYLIYGNSDNVRIGEWVLAVGNPFNLTSTVTAGIVSAKARNINILGGGSAIETFIQTDAAVNPGNSGGALVNTKGELIGINAAIASNTGSFAGYSFAIPVNITKKVVEDLINYGEIQRAYIGVSISDVTEEIANEKKLKDIKGVYISGIVDHGSAEDAGIQEGDIITSINDIAVNSTSELLGVIAQYRPADKVNISYWREGKSVQTTIVLKNKNGDTGIIKQSEKSITSLLGGTFEEISSEEKSRLRLEYGLKITKLEAGKLKNAGIKEGFIITHIDKKPIKTTNDIDAILKNKTGGILIEGAYPNGMRAYYGFGL